MYSPPSEHHVLRQFCGFCGTPLSFWTEQPRSEADYIQLTLGSLLSQDLRDLEEMGLFDDDSDEDQMALELGLELELEPAERTRATAPAPGLQLIGREFTDIPWFDSMMQGSRLGNARTSRGVQQSQDGRVRVEWEVSEWTADDDTADQEGDSSATGKRKRGEGDHGNGAIIMSGGR
jgi:hypothetical protein